MIDDRQSNIDAWESEGGIGILHKNARDTINELKRLRSGLKVVESEVETDEEYKSNISSGIGVENA